ncbi:MAG: adenine nucleotide alpha hydrolase family protein [Clostridia bacterium]|nr:adenine nucleotide alpha hydrolase family protein [Clostridia bacterium]
MQKLLSRVRRCVDDYRMIAPGDRVAVGVSGGKDSLCALLALHELSKFHPAGFTVTAITVTGFPDMDFSPVAELCESRGIPYISTDAAIYDIVFRERQEKNPCSLCAKLRRGALNTAAKAAGCSKVALGHHLDDAVETYLLSLLREGRISCFSPVTYLDRTDITVIRPLLYLYEKDVRAAARRNSFPVVHNTCPRDGESDRAEVKELLHTLSLTEKAVKERIFGAMQRYPLPGWAPDHPPRSRKGSILPLENEE